MNCRARAEELARRLQSRVKVGAGASHALEHTSLVSPTAEGPYSSMECRHSSLDDTNFDNLADHNLRPIHVVTSEPTLHLRLPSPPLNSVAEQDSDVYYDFDLVSPDDVAVEVGEQQDEKRSSSYVNGERPESGCVTSVTSPLMFDDEGDEDAEGNDNRLGVSRDLYVPQATSPVACSPDADLRAVRHILSSASLTEKQKEVSESSDVPFDAYKRFSDTHTDGDNEAGGSGDHGDNEIDVGNEEVISVCDKVNDKVSDTVSESLASPEGERDAPGEDGSLTRTDSASSEGARDGVDKWQERQHHQQQHQQPWSGQVKMPVANTGSCWCHTASGIEPARHLPAAAPDSYSANAEPGYSDYSESVIGHHHTDDTSYKDSCDAPVMTDDEASEERVQGSDRDPSLGIGEKGEEKEAEVPPEASKSPSLIHSQERLERDLSPLRTKSEEPLLKVEETLTVTESSVEGTVVVPSRAISGTTSPPPRAETHLYAPSEGQPAVMEARGGSEGDLSSKDESLCADSDNEVIETLGDEEEEEEEEEENEEDIEEEVILTGKFRNIRGYTERVRRLSDEIEDRPPPPVVVVKRDRGDSESERPKSADADDEDDQVSTSDLASQLSQLDVEDEATEGDEDVDDEDDENVPCESRSSSEETDPARIEDFKKRIKRSSSLKSGKTPPGTPGRKKIVRFADVLGLDLAAVRTFLGGVPHVPRSAFWDLEVERENAAAHKNVTDLFSTATCVPRRVLTPLFQQPGCHPDFIDRVRHQKVVIENVVIGDDMSVRGVIRVLSMDMHKSVFVRYTFDQWRNYHEAIATYVPNSHDGATDRFSFLLWGSFLQDNAALCFCVRYNTMGQEFWDNNHGRNYTLQCYTSLGIVGDSGTSSIRPQNSSSVQQQIMAQGSPSASGSQAYNSFGSPVTPNDPWVTRFF